MKTYLKSRVKGQVKKMLVKNVVQKYVWSEKKFWSEKKSFDTKEIFGLKIFFLRISKNFGLKTILYPKKIWSEENFWSKKIWVKKMIGLRKKIEKKFWPHIFCPKIFLCLKIFFALNIFLVQQKILV